MLYSVPGICVGSAQDIYTKCFNTTLLECQQCGIIRGAIFLFVVVCLGLAILIGNVLTVLVGIRRCRRGKESKMDICRTSLAMADILASVQLMFVIFNFSWSMNMTPLELDRKQIALRGSPLAITAGILIVFGFTSSMYHLAFMALERFYAIALPFKYKWQSKRSVYFGIAIIWMLTATAPSLISLPEATGFTFTYWASLFIFAPSPTNINWNLNSKSASAAFVFATFYLLPYLLTTALLLSTSIALHRNRKLKQKRFRNAIGQNSKNKTSRLSGAPFITVAMMQIAFTVSTLPALVMASLTYLNVIGGTGVSIANVVCSYIALNNSFVNIVIYNIRDKEFRKEIRQIWKATLAKNWFRRLSESIESGNSTLKSA
ncbi:unnamed protein product, partial [Clavelina lepadiformis]